MKVNFVSMGWIATDITIGSGPAFHIHMIASSPTASFDDFYFAGEALSLTDGVTIKSFENIFGFIMKSKIKSLEETCFNLPTDYSINMSTAATIAFGAENFLNFGSNNWGSAIAWFNNL